MNIKNNSILIIITSLTLTGLLLSTGCSDSVPVAPNRFLVPTGLSIYKTPEQERLAFVSNSGTGSIRTLNLDNKKIISEPDIPLLPLDIYVGDYPKDLYTTELPNSESSKNIDDINLLFAIDTSSNLLKAITIADVLSANKIISYKEIQLQSKPILMEGITRGNNVYLAFVSNNLKSIELLSFENNDFSTKISTSFPFDQNPVDVAFYKDNDSVYLVGANVQKGITVIKINEDDVAKSVITSYNNLIQENIDRVFIQPWLSENKINIFARGESTGFLYIISYNEVAVINEVLPNQENNENNNNENVNSNNNIIVNNSNNSNSINNTEANNITDECIYKFCLDSILEMKYQPIDMVFSKIKVNPFSPNDNESSPFYLAYISDINSNIRLFNIETKKFIDGNIEDVVTPSEFIFYSKSLEDTELFTSDIIESEVCPDPETSDNFIDEEGRSCNYGIWYSKENLNSESFIFTYEGIIPDTESFWYNGKAQRLSFENGEYTLNEITPEIQHIKDGDYAIIGESCKSKLPEESEELTDNSEEKQVEIKLKNGKIYFENPPCSQFFFNVRAKSDFIVLSSLDGFVKRISLNDNNELEFENNYKTLKFKVKIKDSYELIKNDNISVQLNDALTDMIVLSTGYPSKMITFDNVIYALLSDINRILEITPPYISTPNIKYY